MKGLRDLARAWVPPALLDLSRRLRGESITFRGGYATWDGALAASRGYADKVIVERVRQALLSVRAGGGAFERDGVVLPNREYDFPLLAGLLYAAATQGRLHVVDIGGSLGGTYFQYRELLRGVPGLKWDVVEQPHFVECGRAEFADDVLGFEFALRDCFAAVRPNMILLSSVLPYVADPYGLIEDVRAVGAEFVLLNRTPALLTRGADMLTVQNVALVEYRTSYPAWLLGHAQMLAAFSPDYRMVWEFDPIGHWSVKGRDASCVGGLLRRTGE